MTNPEGSSAKADVGLLEKQYRRNKDFVSRQIAGEFLLIPVTNRLVGSDSLFVLNEVGARIWELIDTGRSVREIKRLLLEEFETSEGELQQDLFRLLGQLHQIGAIQTVGG